MVTMCFYANAGFGDSKWIGVVIIIICSLIGFCRSKSHSELPFMVWYHEIMFCGVDKLSMSITDLSNIEVDKTVKKTRHCWMGFFELWFGSTIKFVAPTILTWLMFHNILGDLNQLYGSNQMMYHVFASIPIFIIFCVIFGSLFTCETPERFYHDVNKEFAADQIFSRALAKELKGKAGSSELPKVEGQ